VLSHDAEKREKKKRRKREEKEKKKRREIEEREKRERRERRERYIPSCRLFIAATSRERSRSRKRCGGRLAA
jgi:hypothetical protein